MSISSVCEMKKHFSDKCENDFIDKGSLIRNIAVIHAEKELLNALFEMQNIKKDKFHQFMKKSKA